MENETQTYVINDIEYQVLRVFNDNATVAELLTAKVEKEVAC